MEAYIHVSTSYKVIELDCILLTVKTISCVEY
jgi:hypothetical protein